MKILLINKFFFLKGGSEKSFFDTANLLQKKGHSVVFFSMSHPDNFESRFSKYFLSEIDFERTKNFKSIWKAFFRILYSGEARNKLKKLVQEESPDIVHLHNIHHQISPSILHPLKNFNIPIVQTLHDYKVVCPVYTMLSQGQLCERCRDRKFYHCSIQRCSKDSFSKSILNTLEMYLHHSILRIYRLVDAFISPSQFLIDKVNEMGFKGKFFYLPNGINTEDYANTNTWENHTIVYSGRLSKEKGIYTLLQAVKGLPIECKIFGDGPEKENLALMVKRENIVNVSLCGYVSQTQLQSEIQKSMFVILPSEWYENNPYAVIEAFAMGKPVIGSRIGGIPELIKDHKTGLTFEPGNAEELRKNVLYLLNNSEKIISLGENAQSFIEHDYNREKQYQELMKIYQFAIEKHG